MSICAKYAMGNIIFLFYHSLWHHCRAMSTEASAATEYEDTDATPGTRGQATATEEEVTDPEGSDGSATDASSQATIVEDEWIPREREAMAKEDKQPAASRGSQRPVSPKKAPAPRPVAPWRVFQEPPVASSSAKATPLIAAPSMLSMAAQTQSRIASLTTYGARPPVGTRPRPMPPPPKAAMCAGAATFAGTTIVVPPPKPAAASSSSSSRPRVEDLPKMTGWKNKLVFFCHLWQDKRWQEVDRVVQKFQLDLDAQRARGQIPDPKARPTPTPSWFSKADQLCLHYQQNNWQAIDAMVQYWQQEPEFAQLVRVATQRAHDFGSNRRRPDWFNI